MSIFPSLTGLFTNTSRPPRVAIPDDFDEKACDIDGDGIADLSHGETIERLVKAKVPNVEVVRLAGVSKPSTLAGAFNELSRQIRQGNPLDSISLSQNVSLSLNPELPICQPEVAQVVTPADVEGIKRQMLEHLPMSEGFANFFSSVAALAKKGVKVYIAGGNEGPDLSKVSAFNLAPGSIGIAATDARRQKTSFSNDNIFLTRAEQGVFSITKVQGGYDITGDDIPDVADAEVSGGTPLVRRIVGRPIEEVAATEDEIYRIVNDDDTELASRRIISTKKLVELGALPPEKQKINQSLGDWVLIHDGKPTFYFDVKPDGTVAFDPDKSGRPNAVSFLAGTSYAAPWAMALDLEKKFTPR